MARQHVVANSRSTHIHVCGELMAQIIYLALNILVLTYARTTRLVLNILVLNYARITRLVLILIVIPA